MTDKNRVEKPYALITGASSGIGEAYSRRLAEKGYSLILTARRKDRLNKTAADFKKRYKTETIIIPADLSTEKGIDIVLKKIKSIKNIEFFVHAAGFGTRGDFADIAESKIRGMAVLHNLAAITLARKVLPSMIKRNKGFLVFVSSLGAFFTTKEYVMYSATKAFLNMFVLGLETEVKKTGVIVQALCPGLTKTEFLSTPEYKDFNYQQIPEFAWMTAEQVIDESVKNLKKSKPVYIPGIMNRLFVSILESPILGTFIKYILGKAANW
jgi:hypothetical protein